MRSRLEFLDEETKARERCERVNGKSENVTPGTGSAGCFNMIQQSEQVLYKHIYMNIPPGILVMITNIPGVA